MAGSLILSGNQFHIAGTATEKAKQRCCLEATLDTDWHTVPGMDVSRMTSANQTVRTRPQPLCCRNQQKTPANKCHRELSLRPHM